MKDILKLTLKLVVVFLISGAWLWFADLLWRRGYQSYLLALTIPGVPALLSFFVFGADPLFNKLPHQLRSVLQIIVPLVFFIVVLYLNALFR
jgi:hypothetical protein